MSKSKNFADQLHLVRDESGSMCSHQPSAVRSRNSSFLAVLYVSLRTVLERRRAGCFDTLMLRHPQVKCVTNEREVSISYHRTTDKGRRPSLRMRAQARTRRYLRKSEAQTERYQEIWRRSSSKLRILQSTNQRGSKSSNYFHNALRIESIRRGSTAVRLFT